MPAGISFDQTNRVVTRSEFSDFVDFVKISKTSQDNHYVQYVNPLSANPTKWSNTLKHGAVNTLHQKYKIVTSEASVLTINRFRSNPSEVFLVF